MRSGWPCIPLRSRHMVRSRRPMVSTLGLTRSKGRVSHAGQMSTSSALRKAARSWASRSASALVGTATTVGWRRVPAAMPAMAKARAGSGTATTAERRSRMSEKVSSLLQKPEKGGEGAAGGRRVTGIH